jgi:5-dehydro-2-deoxygluconokinase
VATDAVVLGRVCADLRPLPEGATTESASGFTRELGGSASNVAVGLARLGLSPALVSAVGDDAHGRYVRAALLAEGVDCTGLVTDSERRTPLTFCDLSDPTHPRILVTRGETAPDWEAGPEALDSVDLAAARVVIGAGTMLWRDASRQLLLVALERSAAALRVLDLDWRPQLWAGRADYGLMARAAIRSADVVVGSPEEVAAAAGDVAGVHALGPRLVVAKRGLRGAVVHRAGEESVELTVEPVDTIDALGPGDALVAALAWRLLAGDDPVDATRVACRAGAHVAARVGCASAMPRPPELA